VTVVVGRIADALGVTLTLAGVNNGVYCKTSASGVIKCLGVILPLKLTGGVTRGVD